MKMVLKLIKKHFTNSCLSRKLFNKNNLKVSYSCTSNMEKQIVNHNRKLLEEGDNKEVRKCNCRVKEEYSLNGVCLIKNIVYEAYI